MGIKLTWNLFKESGKWAYGGEVEVSGTWHIWDDELLQEIDDLQTEVRDGLITSRSMTLVIMETKEQQEKPDYHGFCAQLYPAR